MQGFNRNGGGPRVSGSWGTWSFWGWLPKQNAVFPIFFTDHGTSLVNAGGAYIAHGAGLLLSVQVPFAVNASASASSKMVRRVDVDRLQDRDTSMNEDIN